jgi:hypothetical protein
MKEIIKLVDVIKKHYNVSEAYIARQLDIPEGTFNAWLTGRLTCRHKRMLGLALARLKEKMVELKEF